MQGWITCFAWISTLAGVANTTAFMLQSLVAANYPNYEPQAWHVTLLIFALLIVGGLMNMYTWFLIPWLETLAGLMHIVLFVIFVVVLVTLAPRHSAEFVFTKSASSSGWTNQFISFNMGLMTPTWGFVGKCPRPSHLIQMTDHSFQVSMAPSICRKKYEKLAMQYPEPCSGQSLSMAFLHMQSFW